MLLEEVIPRNGFEAITPADGMAKISVVEPAKNDEKCEIKVVLTKVNGFGFRSEILYLCITEVEIVLEIRVISTFFIPKNPFLGAKNKLPCFFKVKQPVFNVTYSDAANRYCCVDV